MSDEKAKIRKLLKEFNSVLRGDAPAQTRIKAVNTLLNGGHNLKVLDDEDIKTIWESLFFALWNAEMGRGCEEIIAAIERASRSSYRLTREGFRTIASKWYGIDQYRVDKVSHLARHLLPVLLQHQIRFWFKSYKKADKKLGSRDVPCKQVLHLCLLDVMNSYGLCYFLLEIMADCISSTLTDMFEKLNVICGRHELKANLVVFLYQQVMKFVANVKLDARLLRTFDQYVIKRLLDDLIPKESQLCQILISLRLYQAIDKQCKRKKQPLTSKCRGLFERWSAIIRDFHEKCINCEFYPEICLTDAGQRGLNK